MVYSSFKPKKNQKRRNTPMVKTKELADLTLKDLFKEVKDEESIWGDLKLEAKVFLKKLVNNTLGIEMRNYLQAEKHQRTAQRVSYRNGFYERDLETGFGLLENLEVPRSRDGQFKTNVFGNYCRRQSEVEALIKDLFLFGISTRKVSEILKPLLDFEVSATTVSNVCKELDREVAKYHSQKLEDKYPYLFLDGVVLKARNALEVKRRVVLVAYGITYTGHKELISFRQANYESEAEWSKFLGDLYRRGFRGENSKLIVVDGCPGLLQAIDMNYPYVPVQRCWVHKLRNIASYLPKKHFDCLKEVKAIYLAKNRRQAVQTYWSWAKKWREIAPKAVNCLEKDIDQMLTFFGFPKAQQIKLRTTNQIERCFVEVRRRTRPMSSFSNYASVDRIIFGIFSYENTKWKNKPLKEFTHNT